MALFKCEICLEKEKRIELLTAQIADLRKMVFPTVSSQAVSPHDQEFDRLMSGVQEAIELDREAQTLLTGSYDESESN